jgi:hypothetical protein
MTFERQQRVDLLPYYIRQPNVSTGRSVLIPGVEISGSTTSDSRPSSRRRINGSSGSISAIGRRSPDGRPYFTETTWSTGLFDRPGVEAINTVMIGSSQVQLPFSPNAFSASRLYFGPCVPPLIH